MVVSIALVERFGRKSLMIFSCFGSCVSIIALGVFFYLDENKTVVCNGSTLAPWTTAETTNAFGAYGMPNMFEECVPVEDGFDPELIKNLGWLPLVSLMVYIFTFSLG